MKDVEQSACPASVNVELERLHGSMEAGFARVDGALALLVQRSDQNDRRIEDHEHRLEALERARWPIASVTTLVAVGTLGLALWQLGGN